jgi:hypothetical protein
MTETAVAVDSALMDTAREGPRALPRSIEVDGDGRRVR